jgi:predicted esterase
MRKRGHQILRQCVTGAAVCLALAAANLWADDAAGASTLRERFAEAYRARDWAQAITVGLEIERLTPDRSAHQYNLACVFALSGDDDAALEWLERAAGNGFSRVDLLATDPDLDAVRDSDRFGRLVVAIQRNSDAVQAEIRRRFRATPPLMYLPPGHDPSVPAPVLIALHGLGDRADGTPTQWRRYAAKRGVMLVLPQGVRPAGPGYSWHSVDEADTILALTIDWLEERATVDKDRVVLAGFSQGGFIAMALATRHPELFAGVIPVAGGYIPEVDSPQPAPGDDAPSYYFMVGSEDDAAPQCRLAAADFAAAGYDVELRVLPGVGHVFPRETSRELRKALHFALGE